MHTYRPSGTLLRLFRKLVIGIGFASTPASARVIELDVVDSADESMAEIDRLFGVVLDGMVERALVDRPRAAEVLGMLLENMHPFDATAAICEAALSPSVAVRRLVCATLHQRFRIVGAELALEHLHRDPDPGVRLAAITAARARRPSELT